MNQKKADIQGANVATLRATHNNQVEIIHRYSGERRSIDIDTWEDEDAFEACGFDASDWVTAREFKGVEEHPRAAAEKKAAAEKDDKADAALKAAIDTPEDKRTDAQKKLILDAQSALKS